jgi:hypothetical protein
MKIGWPPNSPLQKTIKFFFWSWALKRIKCSKKIIQVLFLSMALIKIKWMLDSPLPKGTWESGGHPILLYKKIQVFFLTWALMRIRWPLGFRFLRRRFLSLRRKKHKQLFDYSFIEEGRIGQPHKFLYFNGL